MNTSEELPPCVKVDIVNKYITKLKVSGYKHEQIKDIVESGMRGYISKVKRNKSECGDRHRQLRDTIQDRKIQKVMGVQTWFKRKGKRRRSHMTRLTIRDGNLKVRRR